ncbi:alpha-beta hydrolase superfamily lysophospholipase [Pseudonocardia kunmingensis]|uniref:Alpha-beta hydrolase superfamily lysophospholipase n=1 Tax=Pseudonocardia kunmingensis TaxID=630975 RepID=A0A543DAL5_9PSEU|nr:alpha-beta hydrolase superfamily lysophospholipase [Pseudonocardia kunmingensis]
MIVPMRVVAGGLRHHAGAVHEAYLRRLPADLRSVPLPRRASTWWRHGDTDVHVERIGDPSARRRAVLLHGAGGHAAAMWPFAALAARRGIHVVVPDLPGYGRTRVPGPGAVRYPDWVALACDLLRAEREAHDGPLLLVGASLGGMVAYDAGTRTGAADALLVTCLPDPRDPLMRRHLTRFPRLSGAARPALRVLAGPLADVAVPVRWLTNMRAIGNDPELVDLVVRDERGGGGRVPLGFLRSFLDSAPAVEPEDATAPRVVLAHPACDRWTPTAMSLRFFDRIAAPKELVLLEGAGHFPVEAPGVHQLVDAIDRACA